MTQKHKSKQRHREAEGTGKHAKAGRDRQEQTVEGKDIQTKYRLSDKGEGRDRQTDKIQMKAQTGRLKTQTDRT